jgi:hypothetical protein
MKDLCDRNEEAEIETLPVNVSLSAERDVLSAFSDHGI